MQVGQGGAASAENPTRADNTGCWACSLATRRRLSEQRWDASPRLAMPSQSGGGGGGSGSWPRRQVVRFPCCLQCHCCMHLAALQIGRYLVIARACQAMAARAAAVPCLLCMHCMSTSSDAQAAREGYKATPRQRWRHGGAAVLCWASALQY